MSEKKKFKMNITNQILIATVLGIVFGAVVGPWSENLKFLGDMFLRLIQQCVIVLVMTAVAVAVANPSNANTGKMGFQTFLWIIIFTLISGFIALGLGLIIQPGIGIEMTAAAEPVASSVANQSMGETILGFVSTNIFHSMAEGNTIQCIVFSLFLGGATSIYTRHTGKTIVYDLLSSLNDIIINILKMVMKVAPIGIFCLLANVTGTVGLSVIFPMIKFLGALLIAVVIELILYAAFVSVKCKVNLFMMPRKFYKMTMLVLTTTSGAVTLPVKMEDMVTKFGISKRVSDFTGPITMAMNSSGGVSGWVLAILFMAQSSGITLSPKELGMAIFLSCMLCLGTIAAPGGAIIIYTFFATSLGLPPESFVVLIGIDWFAGALRALNNVDVDVLLAMLVANKLGELDRDVYNGKKTVTYE